MTRNELWDMLVDYSVHNKSFPKAETFAAYSKIPKDTMEKVYKMWIQEGKLERDRNGFIFTDSEIQSKISEPEIKEEIKEESVVENTEVVSPVVSKVRMPYKKKAAEKQNNFILKIVKMVAVVVGILLTTDSIRFTSNFNNLAMNMFWSLMLSVPVVCFMSFAFTIRSYVTEKSTRMFIVILWILGISYSVFTAVSGQFNEFRKYTASDNTVQIENKNKIYENQLKALEKKQTELLHWREQETEYSLNPDLKVENPVTWVKIQNGVEELKKVESDITDVQEKLLGNINTEVVLEETVYNWLASFLGIRADIIQFIIILFPALFIDLCSTVCFTFALGKENS